MIRKLFAFLCLCFFGAYISSCANSKTDKSTEQKNAHIQFYKGDSLLTESFQIFHDSTGRIFKTNCIEEGIIEKTENDTYFLINVYTILGPGYHNGACELKNDTLYAYFWIDSAGCVSAQSGNIIQYQIKKVKFNTIQFKELNSNPPYTKACQEDIEALENK